MPPSTPASQQVLTWLCFRTVALPHIQQYSKDISKRKKTQAEGYRHARKQHRNPSQNTSVAECSLHPSDHT